MVNLDMLPRHKRADYYISERRINDNCICTQYKGFEFNINITAMMSLKDICLQAGFWGVAEEYIHSTHWQTADAVGNSRDNAEQACNWYSFHCYYTHAKNS